jgi:hypothetical protein
VVCVRIPLLDALLNVSEGSRRGREVHCSGRVAGTRNLVAQLVVVAPEMLVGVQDLQGCTAIGGLTELGCLVGEDFRDG